MMIGWFDVAVSPKGARNTAGRVPTEEIGAKMQDGLIRVILLEIADESLPNEVA